MSSCNEKFANFAETDPDFRRRRKFLVFAFSLRTFFIAVEYSIILPSVLLYLKRFEVHTVINGLVVGAYPFGGIISPPIFGRLYDRTQKVRELFFILNTLQIIGNVIYAIPVSPWMLLAGRFICGLGDGAVACVTGEIMRVYPKSARTGMISLIEMGRVPGLVIGPAFNFFIGEMNFKVYNWILDFTTLPGVVMAIGWAVMQLVTICLVTNLSKDMEQQYLSEDDVLRLEATVIVDSHSEDNEDIFEDTSNLISKEKNFHQRNKNQMSDKTSFYSDMIHNCSIELVFLGFVDSVLWTIQTIFEILIPYITEFEYGWTPSFSGLAYAVGAILLVLVFLLLYWIGKYYAIRDTYLLLFSLVLASLALLFLLAEATLINRVHRIVTCGLMCFLIFTAAPINLVASKSLITKITTPEIQGLIQGIYTSVTKVSMIIGPIIGSIIFHHRKVYSVVAIGLVIISFLGMLLFLKSFHRREDQLTEEEED